MIRYISNEEVRSSSKSESVDEPRDADLVVGNTGETVRELALMYFDELNDDGGRTVNRSSRKDRYRKYVDYDEVNLKKVLNYVNYLSKNEK
jgi:hypothetical protein